MWLSTLILSIGVQTFISYHKGMHKPLASSTLGQLIADLQSYTMGPVNSAVSDEVQIQIMLAVYSGIIYRDFEIVSVTEHQNLLKPHKLSRDQSKLYCTTTTQTSIYKASMLHVRRQTQCQLLHRLFRSTEASLPALLDPELLTDEASLSDHTLTPLCQQAVQLPNQKRQPTTQACLLG